MCTRQEPEVIQKINKKKKQTLTFINLTNELIFFGCVLSLFEEIILGNKSICKYFGIFMMIQMKHSLKIN